MKTLLMSAMFVAATLMGQTVYASESFKLKDPVCAHDGKHSERCHQPCINACKQANSRTNSTVSWASCNQKGAQEICEQLKCFNDKNELTGLCSCTCLRD